MSAAEEKNSPSRSQPLESLESPFLNHEPFTEQGEEEWGTHLGALEAQSPFLSAFDPSWVRPGAAETESAEAFGDEHVSAGEFEFEEQGIIKGENRLRVKDTTGVPWRWICKILVEDSRGRPAGSGAGGTGVLISNKHVLTAAHVVYEAYKNMQQYTITVIPALDDLQQPFDQYALASKPKIRKEYSPDATDNLDWDYALLTLDKSVGEKKFKALRDIPLCYWASPQCGANTIFARLDPRTLNGQAAFTAGYPGGKGGKQLWCAAGILHSANEKTRTMRTTADITRGQSGSPVWVIDNKRHCLVGVAAGAGTNSNIVVRVTRELIRQLRAWIKEEGETPAMIETEEAFEPPVQLVPEPEAEDQPYATGEEYAPPAAEFEHAAGEDKVGFAGVTYEEGEVDRLDEQPLEEQFDPTVVPKDVSDALGKQDWPLSLKLAIKAGWRDENDLTNLIFFARHPELPIEPLKPGDPNFKTLSAEWTKILNKEVWKAIQVSAENTDLVVSGEEVTDHHRSFFRGKSGKRLRQLIEDAAREVDLNPGLLGTIMMAETRRPLSYLSSEKVSSYHIGCDDFYEARAAIKARVPAYTKVNWDKKQTPVEHLNDAKKNPRLVKTILFDSGPDAALATAVYVKFREVRLREIAAELGKDFDSLPLPTRLALTRMAMAAGTGGATPYLKDALNGADIFVRKAIPVRVYQTQRNATVRTAQAMHLSDWIFGIPVEAATRPAAHEAEVWNEAEAVPDDLDSSLEGESGEDSEDVEVEEAQIEGEIDDEDNSVISQHDVPHASARLVSVGERIEFDLTKTAFGASLDKIRWTIPGRVVAGYEGSVSEARLFELTSADLQRPTISFFWVDAAHGRTVRAKITTKSGMEQEFVAVFDVEGPAMNSFKGEPGITRIEKEHGTVRMQFGKPLEAPGIRWRWKVTLPTHHAGFVKDVQTVLMDRTRIQYLKPVGNETRTLVIRHPSETKPHVQIDTDSDEEAIYTLGMTEEKIEAGKTDDSGYRGIEDSPSDVLFTLDKTFSVNDQFTYYIMFKPEMPKPGDAIWVPVAKAKWSWNATADQRGKKWSLRKASKMRPSIEMATVEFPLYQSKASENEWDDASPAASHEQLAWELEETEESEQLAGPRYKTVEYPEPLMEELVPKVSTSDLRKRLDEYFDHASVEYILDNGNKVRARPQFHIASVGSPEKDAETIERLFEKKFGAKFSRPLHTAIRCAAYGRARPDEIKVITQRLIDAGELEAARDDNPGFSDEQLVRALQRKFNIGIDCAGYVQLAFIYAFTGKHDVARCNLGSLKLREDMGLKAKRSDENLAALPVKHFTEVGFLNGQTGDLLVLAWRKGERDWHTVIVVDHIVADNVHTFLVDASWGFLYGADAAGVARRKFMYDESTGNWWDIHPIDGTKVNENSTGPYKEHPIKGMYRAREK